MSNEILPKGPKRRPSIHRSMSQTDDDDLFPLNSSHKNQQHHDDSNSDSEDEEPSARAGEDCDYSEDGDNFVNKVVESGFYNAREGADVPPPKIFENNIHEATPSMSFQYIVLFGLVMVGLSYTFMNTNMDESEAAKMTINEARTGFHEQEESLWTSFEAGVYDVVNFTQPSNFIFLYKEDAAKTTEELLDKLAKFAVCHISSCSKSPIILTEGDLNTSDIVEDYGIVLERYKERLEDVGVMIVRNLDKVPGQAAQAFHVFADEVNPLVGKALFIYTIQIAEEPPNYFKFLEVYLKNVWSDLDQDIFYPLLTRITSIVLEIYPE